MSAPEDLVITGGAPIRGRLRLPGCKGISHRALLFGAIAEGDSRVRGLASGQDVRSTARALVALGVTVHDIDGTTTVAGRGFDGLVEPSTVLDCGNSATTMRMLTGLLAGRPFLSVLTGDASLVERPMARVAAPLRTMGARIDGRHDGERAPLVVRGGALTATSIRLPAASGQVKTALVLAALQAAGTTEIVEPAPSRDHTERMLVASGAPIQRIDDRSLRVTGGAPTPFDLDVPGDPSSAAFFVVAAVITPGSELLLEDVLLNPGRIEFVEVLQRMGAHIELHQRDTRLGEPVGDIAVTSGPLGATVVDCHEAIIDEVPALAVAAAFADGVTEFREAAEMRVKETDRIATLEQELSKLGVGVEARPDAMTVRGGAPRRATFDSHGDHRIARAAAVAASAFDGESRIIGWRAAAVSYPAFADDLARLTGSGT
ncbi:MAG: 3-phosphoshikimate 1-carboxyvinyltransferase [Acidimicrobiia bacterium]|nr:3-phosphoshikimate 1-carboxyvinyltransferase [Acidimicrobiia bacterium]